MSVGYDHINVSAVKARGIVLGYTPDVLTDATADLTVLLALGASRRIKESIRAAEDGHVRLYLWGVSDRLIFYNANSGVNGLPLGYVDRNSQTRH